MSQAKRSRFAQQEVTTPERSLSVDLEHQRKKALKSQGAVKRQDTEEEKSTPISTPQQQKTTQKAMTENEVEVQKDKRPLSEVDVVKDVLKKYRKSDGKYEYVPLCVGRIQDMWFKPSRVDIEPYGKSTRLIMVCNVLLDTSPNMINPEDKKFEITFKSDCDEVMKISYLMDRFMRELHSERVWSMMEFQKLISSQLEAEGCEVTEQVLSKKAFDYVSSQVITRVPNTFQLFITKKPCNKFDFPPCVMMMNRNSLQCMARSGFLYEYRIRLFICDHIDKEEISDDEEGDKEEEFPESQDPLL